MCGLLGTASVGVSGGTGDAGACACFEMPCCSPMFAADFVFLVALSRKRLNFDSIAGEREGPANPQQSLRVDGMSRSQRSHSAYTEGNTVRGV